MYIIWIANTQPRARTKDKEKSKFRLWELFEKIGVQETPGSTQHKPRTRAMKRNRENCTEAFLEGLAPEEQGEIALQIELKFIQKEQFQKE